MKLKERTIIILGILILVLGFISFKYEVDSLKSITGAAAQQCIDTDNGKNYSLKGSVNGLCLDCVPQAVGDNTDLCINSTSLMEFYCTTQRIRQRFFDKYIYLKIEGWKRETVNCLNGCSNGACKPAPATCTDSDGGKIYDVKGTATGLENGIIVTSTDNCRGDGKTLAEVYCSGNNLLVGQQYICPNGCSNGACLIPPAPEPCKDSDGGKNYYIKGYVNTSYGGSIDICDSTNPGMLFEYYCLDEQQRQEHYTCPYGCSDGACIQQSVQNITCIDSDGGRDYNVTGEVTLPDGTKHKDFCSPTSLYPNYLMEYWCSPTGLPTKSGYYCPFKCENGACKTQTQNITCIDTDSGVNYTVAGEVLLPDRIERKDTCAPPTRTIQNYLIEWSCSLTGLPVTTGYNCPYRCENGVCVGVVCRPGEELETQPWKCSSSKPYYCDGSTGYLNSNCNLCGCEVYNNPNYPNLHFICNKNDGSCNIGDECLIGKKECLDSKTRKYCTNSGRWATEDCSSMCPTCFCENGLCKSISKVSCPSNTECTSFWPTDEGQIVGVNGGPQASCNLFEVCNPALDKFIDEAKNACKIQLHCELNPMSPICNDSSNSLKKCIGLYIINSLGTNANFMQGYFSPEICCGYKKDDLTDRAHCGNLKFVGKCDSVENPISSFNLATQQLKCRPNETIGIYAWTSDDDISKNSCNRITYPAHAILNILKTGTCQDYSVALTTLLRKGGYSPYQVLSVSGLRHAYNLVKFPGDEKYHVIDTTGNGMGLPEKVMKQKDTPTGRSRLPVDTEINTRFLGKSAALYIKGYTYYDYCGIKMERCYNDMGNIPCPDISQIYGCEDEHSYRMDFCRIRIRDVVSGQDITKKCDECFYSFEGDRLTGCCRMYIKVLGVRVGRKTQCDSINIYNFL